MRRRWGGAPAFAATILVAAAAVARPAPGAVAAAPSAVPRVRHPAPSTALRLADMGMGAAGPQLGGSGGDMVVDDPGHGEATAADMVVDQPGRDLGGSAGDTSSPGRDLAPAADMAVANPGYVPAPPAMDIAPQRDLDGDDAID